MESRLPSLGTHRWRTATLIASAVAALELVLLLVAGAALLARPLSHQARAEQTPRAAAKVPSPAPPPVRKARTPTAPKLSRAKTAVLVLNGNGATGAAGAAAARVKSFGYRIAKVGDAARMDYPTSVVMYRPGFEREGKRLAKDLGIEVVGPLDGLRVRELVGAHVALVVGH